MRSRIFNSVAGGFVEFYSRCKTETSSGDCMEVDLLQVDCETAKASDSQDNESEGRSRESTCSACGILNLICILLAPKKLDVT